MKPTKGERKQSKFQHWQERQERSRANREELEEVNEKIKDLRDKLNVESAELNSDLLFTHFNQLPISQTTQLGLERGNYKKMTPIQQDALPLALTGNDVLGAAKTGSGKTLSFIIPVLERLFLERWDADAGIGALILSPTRELALQIFKVLQLVGYKHVMSAALLTGGRDVNEERKRLHLISIIVGTPGRVLHHLRDASEATIENLQLFVMDEADRLLDMGFRETITAILDYLPSSRQTLLFSATQTTDVKMLASMSLRNPKYVASHAMSAAPTPSGMNQNFLVIELHRKLDALLMFLKRHPNDKVVVFVSTCNQVKYMYLAFSKVLKKMRIPSMCLTSKMKQFRREEVFLTFCRCKAAVLFCTDVAARGLDFPLVHWVVQYDCPDSAQTYIHRAGRTARGGARGASLLFLTPTEAPMLSYLAHKKVPLREVAIRPSYLQESKEIFVALVVQGLKYEAQKAFIAYLRSVYFASNKNVFSIATIDVEKFAHSLGLLVVPNLSDLQVMQRSAKNLPWDIVNGMARLRQSEEGAVKGPKTRKERHLEASDMFRQMEVKQRYLSEGDASASQSDDEFLVKRIPKAPLPAAQVVAKGKQNLTFEERMEGLSKNKKRKFIESADVRIKDLGLSTHIVFDTAEDDDDADEQAEGAGSATRKTTTAVRLQGLAAAEDPEASETDEDDEAVPYSERMRQRLRMENSDDALRVKQLRRKRLLKRAGRLHEGGVAFGTSDDRRRGEEADGDDDATEGSDSGFSSDGSLGKLLRAARGELYEAHEGVTYKQSDVSEENAGMEDAQGAPKVKKARREVTE